jgi:RimJ/RimL family protein N-acetyltransferase
MSIEDYRISQLAQNQVTPSLRALFNPADPASLRCFAVLDGHAAGRIFTDHLDQPTWGVVQEVAFGSLYLGGDVQQTTLQHLITQLRLDGEVLVGLWTDDFRWSLLTSAPDYSGYTLEFTDREAGQPLPAAPTGCELRRLDQSRFKQIIGRNLLIHMFGSVQHALEEGYGLCLTRNGEILCETFAGPAANGVSEIGVETHPHHMQKGYAALTCIHLIHEMERQGYLIYWNCAKQNLASIVLAHKLGYRNEKEYRLHAWFKTNTS